MSATGRPTGSSASSGAAAPSSPRARATRRSTGGTGLLVGDPTPPITAGAPGTTSPTAGSLGVNATVADDDGGYLRARLPSLLLQPLRVARCGHAHQQPTPSPNWTATISPTSSPTPACPGGMLADLSANSQTNNWGGAGSAATPAPAAPATFALLSPGESGGYCANLTGNSVQRPPPAASAAASTPGATAADISRALAASASWFQGSARVLST